MGIADGCGLAAARIGRWVSATLVALLVMAAVVLTWRRLDGSLVGRLPASTLAITAFLLAALAAGARVGHRRTSSTSGQGGAASGPSTTCPTRYLNDVAVSIALVLIALGLCPGSSPPGVVLLWIVLVAEECWAWWGRGKEKGEGGREDRTIEVLGPDVLQQLTLSQSLNGDRQLSGWLRIPLEIGQRTGTVHVSFCPPFPATPELEVEQIDGPEAHIETVQLLPYGVRLDVKLRQAVREPASVLLQFTAAHDEESIGPSPLPDSAVCDTCPPPA
jgi:hypothetical protein